MSGRLFPGVVELAGVKRSHLADNSQNGHAIDFKCILKYTVDAWQLYHSSDGCALFMWVEHVFI